MRFIGGVLAHKTIQPAGGTTIVLRHAVVPVICTLPTQHKLNIQKKIYVDRPLRVTRI